jgi:hypothetical protein
VNYRSIIAALTASIILASCDNTGALPGRNAVEAGTVTTVASQTDAGRHTLYILNTANPDPTVAVYTDNGKTLLRTIDLGPAATVGVPELAVDSKQRLLASNGGSLNIYNDRGAKLVKTLTQSSGWNKLTLDSSDNLYASCGARDLCEHAMARQKVTRRLKNTAPLVVATDRFGDVAIGTADRSVLVYPPTGTTASWKLSSISAYALAFDQAGNLYVADASGIGVYAPGTSTPSRTIELAFSYATSLYFDSSGNLYAVVYFDGIFTIQVYAPGGSRPVVTVDQGIDWPSAIAFGADNRLYVANHGDGRGDPGSAAMFRKLNHRPKVLITNGVYIPTGIAFTQ